MTKFIVGIAFEKWEEDDNDGAVGFFQTGKTITVHADNAEQAAEKAKEYALDTYGSDFRDIDSVERAP